jgi:hypothetical protein
LNFIDNKEKAMNTRNDLSTLVNMEDPGAVLKEIKTVVRMVFPDFDFTSVEMAFDDTVRLFRGEYPGFSECNTDYHDLRHTTDVTLAMARLIHGLHVEGNSVSREMTALSLICAVMHDTGYIQRDDDPDGTGGKYTAVHVSRSIEFAKAYLEHNGFPKSEIEKCTCMITATDLSVNLADIPFETWEEALVGRMLFAADLLGQMSDRVYLEKLLFLFREFSEGGVPGYANEDELLRKTIGFYGFICQRLEVDAGYSGDYMRGHFRERWGMDVDFYHKGIDNNIDYLRCILENHMGDYRGMLNRNGMVKKIMEMEKAGV